MEHLKRLFMEPMQITGIWRLLMLVPLAISISVVWSTMRRERMAAIPMATLKMSAQILVGMMLIGIVLYGVFQMLA